MKYFKKLVGERIYLSPLNIDDTEKYVEWLNDFNVTDGTGRSGSIISLESEKESLLKMLNDKNSGNFAIVNLENDNVIGNCSIHHIDVQDRTATVGIFIGDEQNRSKGYGTEALKLLIDYAFNYLNMNNIMLGVKSFNERAINCYKKVGFKEFGRRRQSYYLNGKYYDDVFMDILKEEFTESYIKNKNI